MNFSNLSDFDFELLAKDVLEKELGIDLLNFKRGPDGGVDLCDTARPIRLIVQVKHYASSKWSNLKSTLLKEKEKVEQINPAKYYLFTSLALTRKNMDEIIAMFPNYMVDYTHIFDRERIIALLKKNKTILRKHYKLWFFSTDILTKITYGDLYIDQVDLFNDLEKDVNHFVRTKAYNRSLSVLNEHNAVIITGNPGVGKSMISKMLLLHFYELGYELRYLSSNNIADLKRSLTDNQEAKEIVLIDDFLGQHYLNIKDTTPNEIKRLVAAIRRTPNKKIILNSRITIINRAKKAHLEFRKFVDNDGIENIVINVDELTNIDKARMLYNHLRFSKLPTEYFRVICENNNYMDIIKHPNYNPRIIEHVTEGVIIKNTNKEDYISFIHKNLNHPESVWENEFMHRLDKIDRIFMFTLYSLTNKSIEEEALRLAFNERIYAEDNIDTTINHFDEVKARLNDSLIKIIIVEKADTHQCLIAVINPSVNDYIKNILTQNSNEQKDIVKNAVYIEQVNKMIEINPDGGETFFHQEQFMLKSLYGETATFYLDKMVMYNIQDSEYKENVKQAFIHVCEHKTPTNSNLIYRIILLRDFFVFYELLPLLLENLINAFALFLFDEVNEAYQHLTTVFGDEVFSESIEEIYGRAIEFAVIDEINYMLPDIVSEEVSRSYYTHRGDEYFPYSSEGDYIEVVREVVMNDMKRLIDEHTNNALILIDEEMIDQYFITESLDIEGAISAHFKAMYEENMEYDDDYYDYIKDEETEIIHQMFRGRDET